MLKPGLYKEKQDLPRMDYLSWAKCKTALNSPRAFYNQYKLGIDAGTTLAMEFGTLVHAAILEPNKYDTMVRVMPDFGDLRSPKNREKKSTWMDEYNGTGLTLVTKDDHERIMAMKERVYEHELAPKLISGGTAEGFAYAKDEASGMWLLGRPDYIRSDYISGSNIIELKTTSEGINWSSFVKTMLNRAYHGQAAWNANVMELLGSGPITEYYFILVDVGYPHDVAVHKLPDSCFKEGMAMVQASMRIITELLEQDPNMDNKLLWQPKENTYGDQPVPPYFFKYTINQ